MESRIRLRMFLVGLISMLITRKTGEWKDPVKRKAVGDRQIRHCQVKRDED